MTALSAWLAASPAAAAQEDARAISRHPVGSSKPESIPEAWPANVQIHRLSGIGRGKAVVFSPDFAESGNRQFYQKLGFLYIEDASWQKALNQIIARNYWHPEDRIETIFLETHGTNGNGLKLQAGVARGARRSYISVAALQEKLEGLRVRLCVIGACNAGRLFRPEIYRALNPRPGDPLFLPATLGIVNASAKYDPTSSKIIVVRRAESEIEATSDGDTSEMSPLARTILGLDQATARDRISPNLHFVVSNLLIQMLIHDPRLKLTASGYTNAKSRQDLSNAESEILFERFLSYINQVAEREYQISHGARLPSTTDVPNGARLVTRPTGYNSRTLQAAAMRAKKRWSRRVID
jgi:hypothetical protein